MELAALGDSALILRVGDSLGEILAAVRRLEAAQLPGVVEVAPAFASVAIFLQSPEHLQVQFSQRAGMCNPGIVHHDVHPAPVRDDGRKRTGHRRGVGDIHRSTEYVGGVAAMGLTMLIGRLFGAAVGG